MVDVMSFSRFAWTVAAALVLSSGCLWADNQEDKADDNAEFGINTSNEARSVGVDGLAKASEASEITINTIGDVNANTPDAVTAGIPDEGDLPDSAAFGNSTAIDAQDGGVDGLAIATEAMDQANQLAQDALESRENAGRSDDLPDVPGDVPPDVPEPPTN
jgi:hypothetical protein